jgi:hypothetical protein
MRRVQVIRVQVTQDSGPVISCFGPGLGHERGMEILELAYGDGSKVLVESTSANQL